MKKIVKESLQILEVTGELSNIEDILEKILQIEKELPHPIHSSTTILQDLKCDAYRYFCLFYQKELIGYASISTVFDTMELQSIVISKTFQRRHLGTYLLDYLLALAKKQQITSLFLEVRASNIAAQNLYESFSFNKIGIRKAYYKNPLEDAYLYKREP